MTYEPYTKKYISSSLVRIQTNRRVKQFRYAATSCVTEYTVVVLIKNTTILIPYEIVLYYHMHILLYYTQFNTFLTLYTVRPSSILCYQSSFTNSTSWIESISIECVVNRRTRSRQVPIYK